MARLQPDQPDKSTDDLTKPDDSETTAQGE